MKLCKDIKYDLYSVSRAPFLVAVGNFSFYSLRIVQIMKSCVSVICLTDRLTVLVAAIDSFPKSKLLQIHEGVQ